MFKTQKSRILCAIVLAIGIVAVAVFLRGPKSEINPSVPSAAAPFVAPTKWEIYENEDILFSYPEGWTAMFAGGRVPSLFSELFVQGDGCNAIIFYDARNPQVLLVAENARQPIPVSQLSSCWAKKNAPSSIETIGPHNISQRKMSTASAVYNAQDMSQIFGAKNDFMGDYPGKEYLIEQYMVVPDHLEDAAYRFSIVYLPGATSEAQSVFDVVVNSARFVRDYKPSLTYPTEWKTFANQKLGFSFEYPAEWGTVTEEIIDRSGAQNDPASGLAGKVYSLSFSQKSNAPFYYRTYGVGQSVDFTAPRESVLTDYKGDPKRPAEARSGIGINLTSLCWASGYPAGLPSTHVIKFNLPGKEISGVMLVFSVLSKSDSQKYNQLIDDFMKKEIVCEDTFGENDGGEKGKRVIEKLAVKEKEISEMLRVGVNFDKESQVNLEIYNRILKSATVLQ